MCKKMGNDLTSRTELAVACAREGRTVASIGGYLTRTEQEQIPEIYSRLVTHEVIREDSPVTAIITSKIGRKSTVTQADAVNWFIEKYPKWSLPLQKKLKETRPPRTRTILAYGLKEGMDLSDDYYVGVIRDIANLPETQARVFFENLVKPTLAKLEELSGLVETEIKTKKD
jgi:hypothetical protein